MRLGSLLTLSATVILAVFVLSFVRGDEKFFPTSIFCPEGVSLPLGCTAVSDEGEFRSVRRRSESRSAGANNLVSSVCTVDNYGNYYQVTLFSDLSVDIRGC